MRKWDGKDRSGKHQYPLKEIEYWDMLISEGGTIWYHKKDDKRTLSVWCTAERLSGHLRSLENIKGKIK